MFSLKIPEYKELMYEEIKLYHDDDVREEYERLKQEFPQGNLVNKYPKERLRTMYKKDPSILAKFKKASPAEDEGGPAAPAQ